VVITDLVNDEPHWRVGLFNPSRNKENERLVNVAVTRAQRRLFIVADFDYCERLSKNAFLGHRFLPFLRQRYKRTSALNVVPAGLSARAASAQSALLGGDVEPTAARLVFTQENYYPILFRDISRASKRVVIYSAFITANRLTTLEPQVKAATDRGIRIYVVTKPRAERSRRELKEYEMLERTLVEWNVVVIHKMRMHEKVVFIDDEILWSSSLNPLSHSDTQEIVERRQSRAVVKDYAAALRLDDLVGAYDVGANKCPVCGGEMMPAEGADDPFYWCCEQGCYTHSIDSPPPRDGMLTCQNCGGQIEFGESGGKPAWRCVVNRHHHQRIHTNHLRLPRMRALIPKRSLLRLDKLFGVSQENVKATDLGKGVDFKGKKVEMKDKGKVVYVLFFTAGKEFEATTDATKDTDVTLYVYDDAGNEIGKDDSPGPKCLVKVTPAKDGKYKFVIKNASGDNTVIFKVKVAK
jgi:hypothetical protein